MYDIQPVRHGALALPTCKISSITGQNDSLEEKNLLKVQPLPESAAYASYKIKATA
jgi:hypothetical protein